MASSSTKKNFPKKSTKKNFSINFQLKLFAFALRWSVAGGKFVFDELMVAGGRCDVDHEIYECPNSQQRAMNMSNHFVHVKLRHLDEAGGWFVG